MDFTQAYLSIVKASIEQDTKEIPVILSCLDFKDKSCLEIGAGPLARIATKILNTPKAPKHITILEKYPQTINAINNIIQQQKLENKISTVLAIEKIKLPFNDNEFDIIYGAWLPHKLITDPNYIQELARVSKKYILLIMPGIDDDTIKLRNLINKEDEKQKRQQYKIQITKILKDLKYKVSYKQGSLKLDFPDKKTIRETFYQLDFANKLTPNQKQTVNNFLDKKIHNFRDDFYCIISKKE